MNWLILPIAVGYILTAMVIAACFATWRWNETKNIKHHHDGLDHTHTRETPIDHLFFTLHGAAYAGLLWPITLTIAIIYLLLHVPYVLFIVPTIKLTKFMIGR